MGSGYTEMTLSDIDSVELEGAMRETYKRNRGKVSEEELRSLLAATAVEEFKKSTAPGADHADYLRPKAMERSLKPLIDEIFSLFQNSVTAVDQHGYRNFLNETVSECHKILAKQFVDSGEKDKFFDEDMKKRNRHLMEYLKKWSQRAKFLSEGFGAFALAGRVGAVAELKEGQEMRKVRMLLRDNIEELLTKAPIIFVQHQCNGWNVDTNVLRGYVEKPVEYESTRERIKAEIAFWHTDAEEYKEKGPKYTALPASITCMLFGDGQMVLHFHFLHEGVMYDYYAETHVCLDWGNILTYKEYVDEFKRLCNGRTDMETFDFDPEFLAKFPFTSDYLFSYDLKSKNGYTQNANNCVYCISKPYCKSTLTSRPDPLTGYKCKAWDKAGDMYCTMIPPLYMIGHFRSVEPSCWEHFYDYGERGGESSEVYFELLSAYLGCNEGHLCMNVNLENGDCGYDFIEQEGK